MNYLIAALILAVTLGAIFATVNAFTPEFDNGDPRSRRQLAATGFATGALVTLAMFTALAGIRWTIYHAFGV